MANALKGLFVLYALHATISSVRLATQQIDPDHEPRLWAWAGLSLCLLPVAWGIIREKKWAWNCAMGLVTVRLFGNAALVVGMLLAPSLDQSAVRPMALHALALNLGIFVVIFAALFFARKSFQTVFPVAQIVGEPEERKNSYFRPVFLGELFLLAGLLLFIHPVFGTITPLGTRLFVLFFAVVQWTAAAMSFFERKRKRVRWLAVISVLTGVVTIVTAIHFETYSAVIGMGAGLLQIVLGFLAILTATKSRRVFVD